MPKHFGVWLLAAAFACALLAARQAGCRPGSVHGCATTRSVRHHSCCRLIQPDNQIPVPRPACAIRIAKSPYAKPHRRTRCARPSRATGSSAGSSDKEISVSGRKLPIGSGHRFQIRTPPAAAPVRPTMRRRAVPTQRDASAGEPAKAAGRYARTSHSSPHQSRRHQAAIGGRARERRHRRSPFLYWKRRP